MMYSDRNIPYLSNLLCYRYYRTTVNYVNAICQMLRVLRLVLTKALHIYTIPERQAIKTFRNILRSLSLWCPWGLMNTCRRYVIWQDKGIDCIEVMQKKK
jgi:hypothetical protein